MEEIKNISKQKYQKLLKSAISKNALEYLLDKQGRKGSDIKYSHLGMADYLMPNNELLSIEEISLKWGIIWLISQLIFPQVKSLLNAFVVIKKTVSTDEFCGQE